MQFHRNAKLGLAGRFALVQSIERWLFDQGRCGQVWGVSPATAHRWWHRWPEGRMRRHERLARVCLIARADLGTRRASWRRSCRSGSVPAGGRPGGDRDWLGV